MGGMYSSDKVEICILKDISNWSILDEHPTQTLGWDL